MLVNTMTIAELKNYICGNSTCAYEARRADDDWDNGDHQTSNGKRMEQSWNTMGVYIYNYIICLYI